MKDAPVEGRLGGHLWKHLCTKSQSPGERRGYPGAHKPPSSLEKWDRGLRNRGAETTDRHMLMPSLPGAALWGGRKQARHHTGERTDSSTSSALVCQTAGAHIGLYIDMHMLPFSLTRLMISAVLSLLLALRAEPSDAQPAEPEHD